MPDRLVSRPAHRFSTGPQQAWLVLCDHASNAIPPELGGLGLGEAELARHVAWDPGAGGVAESLAKRLACPAFFGCWSRLVVDLNRAPEAGDLILGENDGVTVHGNLPLPDAERERRIATYHRPYHLAIQQYLLALERQGVLPAIIAVHSFTPVLNGQARPWEVGVLWKRQEPWLPRLVGSLARMGLNVGDNAPYDGRAALGYSLEHHALSRGLRHVLVEIRQDLIGDAASQQMWAGRLQQALAESGFLAPCDQASD
jgi:predicted N-formylglutamate amidohydrolase